MKEKSFPIHLILSTGLIEMPIRNMQQEAFTLARVMYTFILCYVYAIILFCLTQMMHKMICKHEVKWTKVQHVNFNYRSSLYFHLILLISIPSPLKRLPHFACVLPYNRTFASLWPKTSSIWFHSTMRSIRLFLRFRPGNPKLGPFVYDFHKAKFMCIYF